MLKPRPSTGDCTMSIYQGEQALSRRRVRNTPDDLLWDEPGAMQPGSAVVVRYSRTRPMEAETTTAQAQNMPAGPRRGNPAKFTTCGTQTT